MTLYEFATWFEIFSEETAGIDGDAPSENSDNSHLLEGRTEPEQEEAERGTDVPPNPQWRANSMEPPFLKRERRYPRWRLASGKNIRLRRRPKCVQATAAKAMTMKHKYSTLILYVPFYNEYEDLLHVPHGTNITELLIDDALAFHQDHIQQLTTALPAMVNTQLTEFMQRLEGQILVNTIAAVDPDAGEEPTVIQDASMEDTVGHTAGELEQLALQETQQIHTSDSMVPQFTREEQNIDTLLASLSTEQKRAIQPIQDYYLPELDRYNIYHSE